LLQEFSVIAAKWEGGGGEDSSRGSSNLPASSKETNQSVAVCRELENLPDVCQVKN